MEPPEERKNFWHPPVWKWALVLALVAGAAFLFPRKPVVKVELLPSQQYLPFGTVPSLG